MARLLSGRVKVTSPLGVSTDRYSYLKLEEAEPNAGAPSLDGQVLASLTDGTRFWKAAPGASAISGITIKSGGSVVGTAESVTTVDFSGDNLTATASGVGATVTFSTSPTFTDLTVSGIATFAAVKDLNVSGVSTFQGNVNLGDEDRLRFGDDNDLQIYHATGGDSRILETGSGNLNIDANNLRIRNAGSSEIKAQFITNGAVELYYDNSKKFETTGYGATVTGTLFTNELTVSGVATISGLSYPSSDGSNNQVLTTNGSGTLSFQSLSALSGFNWETDGQDFGLITDSVTTSTDNGLVTQSVANSYTLGFIVVTGLIYPTQFVLPSYTVATLPSAATAGAMLFVTDETGGSVPAFSDGTNWRRVTDRSIVS